MKTSRIASLALVALVPLFASCALDATNPGAADDSSASVPSAAAPVDGAPRATRTIDHDSNNYTCVGLYDDIDLCYEAVASGSDFDLYSYISVLGVQSQPLAVGTEGDCNGGGVIADKGGKFATGVDYEICYVKGGNLAQLLATYEACAVGDCTGNTIVKTWIYDGTSWNEVT